MPRELDRRRWILGALGLAAAAALVTTLVVRSQRPPEGPQPIVWDAEACTHCHMLIGEPGFAAQLSTDDGRVLDFDDPGCLLRYLADERPHVHALYFHHATEDRWIPGAEVAFRRVASSPMGWGLAAVDRREPHDLDRAAAERQVAAASERPPVAHAEVAP
jgi:copper chaperone NosL